MHGPLHNGILGSHPSNIFNKPTQGMDYDMKLRHVGVNANGAHIFSDPMQRCYVKIVEFLTPILQVTWVECQGDSCIAEDGSRYVPIADLENADKMGLPTGQTMKEGGYGVNTARDEPASSHTSIRGMSFPNPTNVSRGQQFTSHQEQTLNPPQRKGKEKEVVWELYHQIEVVRVPQDMLIQIVYKSTIGAYYSTTNVRGVELPMKLVLCYKTLTDGSSTSIVDIYKNQYVMLDWNELGKITWQGKPVVTNSAPTHTAGPEESAYYGETVNA